MRRLKLYTDRKYLHNHDRHVTLLNPFWGDRLEGPDAPDAGRFTEYNATGNRWFELVEAIEEADFAVLPGDWQTASSPEQAQSLAKVAAAHGKQVLIFFNHDSDETIPIENALIFRTSFRRSRKQDNEFAFPAWSIDFANYFGGQLPVSAWTERPVVGYCGYVDYQPGDWGGRGLYACKKAYSRIRGLERSPGPVLRGQACRRLVRSEHIDTRFIYRSDFWGGAGWQDMAAKNRVRQEYVQNMAESPYCLVTRGAGNFSFRLYEVLSLGKIPVFLDTDCVLPFDHLIDWKAQFVWLADGQHHRVEEAVLAFHRRFTPESFVAHQQHLRALYEEWLSATGFFKNMWRCLPLDAELAAAFEASSSAEDTPQCL